MNKTIYKYELEVFNEQELTLPVGAEILSIQTQGNAAKLWALVDVEAKNVKPYTIFMFGTGHTIPEDKYRSMKYISTFQLNGGALVFHAFLKF